MEHKHQKGKNKGNVSHSKKTNVIRNKNSLATKSSLFNASPSNGWFTKEDAKKVTREVIGKFYKT